MATISGIYDHYARMVYFSAYSVCRDRETAWDVLQIVFMRCVEQENTLRRLAEGQLRAWLFKVTRNAVLDMVKRRARELPSESPILDGIAREEPETLYLKKDEDRKLMEALQGLPDRYRTPIELCYFAGLSGREAAKLLGIKESTMRSQISRAKDMLQKILMEEVAQDGST